MDRIGYGQYRSNKVFQERRDFGYFPHIYTKSRNFHNLNKASLVRRKYDQKLFVIKEVKIRGMTDEEKKIAMKEVKNLKKLRNLTQHIVQ